MLNLTGRDTELRWLAERLGRREPAGLHGPAGIGKTALLHVAATQAHRPVHSGIALAALSHRPYLPLSAAFRAPVPAGDGAQVARWAATRAGEGTLVLDDLQWADPWTLEILPTLARSTRLLVAVRSGDSGSPRALAAAAAASILVEELHELPAQASEALVRRRAPNLPDAQVMRIVSVARGNPLFLEELADAGDLSRATQSALRARLSRCSTEAATAMAIVGLLGRDAELHLVGGGAAELVEAGLVLRVGDKLRARHASLAEEAARRVSLPRRRKLHAALAPRLDDPGEAARHFEAAGDRANALRTALSAAHAARREGEAATHLAVAARNAEGDKAIELRLQAAEGLVDAGWAHEALLLIDGLVVAPPLAARYALALARALSAVGRAEDALGCLRAASRDAPHDRDAVRLRAQELTIRAYTEATGNLPAEALELQARAHALGVETLRADWAAGAALYWDGGDPASLPLLRAARAEARRSRDFSLECQIGLNLFGAAQFFQRPEEARAVARDLGVRARRRGLRKWELTYRWCVTRIDLLAGGKPGRAISTYRRLLDDPAIDSPTREHLLADLAVAFAFAGRFEEAAGVLPDPMPEHPGFSSDILVWARINLALLAGRPRDVFPLSELLDTPGSRLRPFVQGARAWALFDLGRSVRGLHVTPAPTADIYWRNGISVRAMLALEDDDPLEAIRLFDEAARSWERLVLEEELRCAWGAGHAALSAGDIASARQRLVEVEKRAEAAGLVPWARRAQRTLRAAGVRRSLPRANRSGPRSLSGREREVLRLVGLGLTTAEVANRLGVQPATVDRVIRLAMSRLGASSRIQAAELAAAGE